MSEKFALLIISTDPSLKIEYAGPDVSFNLLSNTLTELFNAHNGSQGNPNFVTKNFSQQNHVFNVCSFYTGSKSKQYVGLPDKIISLFLPSTLNEKDYLSILTVLASRLMLDVAELPQRTYILSRLLEQSNISLSDEIFLVLSRIDDKLHLNKYDSIRANQFELLIKNFVKPEQRKYLKTLKKKEEEPARTSDDLKLLEDLEETFKLVEEKAEKEAATTPEDEIREMLYQKLAQAEAEKKAIEKQKIEVEQHTKQNVESISKELQEKINIIQEKDKIIADLQTQNKEISDSVGKYVNDLMRSLREKMQEIEEKTIIINQLKSQIANNIVGAISTAMGTDPRVQMQLQQLQAENMTLKQQLQSVEATTKEYVDQLQALLQQKTQEVEDKDKRIFELEMELEILKKS